MVCSLKLQLLPATQLGAPYKPFQSMKSKMKSLTCQVHVLTIRLVILSPPSSIPAEKPLFHAVIWEIFWKGSYPRVGHG